nr:MAG TPA: hypothetical protein [Caudoviricetes sp.]DAS62669.1 MAG TPA: hypothetical protein [Bacteriophage sp.]
MQSASPVISSSCVAISYIESLTISSLTIVLSPNDLSEVKYMDILWSVSYFIFRYVSLLGCPYRYLTYTFVESCNSIVLPAM